MYQVQVWRDVNGKFTCEKTRNYYEKSDAITSANIDKRYYGDSASVIVVDRVYIA